MYSSCWVICLHISFFAIIFVNLWVPCVRLVWCCPQYPLCLVWARRLLEVCFPLRCTTWPNLLQFLLFYPASSKLLDLWDSENEKRRTEPQAEALGSIPPADHQMAFLHSPVLFMWRDLRPVSASGSRVFLGGILAASPSQQDITEWK